jgi:hypothetical protein
MTKYITYIRTSDGSIERKPECVVTHPDDSPDPYFLKDTLSGFPENTVFWASNAGPSVGIAPVRT